MEQKTEKKELKIALGILLTVAVLAVIVAVIIVAVQSGSRGSVLFRGQYDYVDPVLYDGTVVVARDGEYFLVKEDRVLSKRYTSLSYNPKNGTYDFTSADGFKGEIDREGKELYKRKITGFEISDYNRTEKAFYFSESLGIMTVHLGEDKLTLKQGDRVYTFAEKNLERLPLGTVLYYDAASGADYITGVVSPSKKFPLAGCTVTGSLLTVFTQGAGYETYRLPSLENIPFLKGAEPTEIFDADGSAVRCEYKDAKYTVSFLNGSMAYSYELPKAPSKIISVNGAGVLLAFTARPNGEPEEAGIYAPALAASGLYAKMTDELFFIGDDLYNNELKRVRANVSATAERLALRADGAQYLYADGNIYSYAAGSLSLKLGAETGTGDVTYRIFKNKIYFISKGILYNNKFNAVLSGAVEFAGENLVKTGDSSFADFSGRPVKNVKETYEVFDFSDQKIQGEYLFETVSGAFESFSGRVCPGVGVQTIERVYKAKTGGFVLKTNLGYLAGETLLRDSEFTGRPELFGESGVAVVSGDRVDTYQVNARNEFFLTETRYYSNIQILCSPYGLVFRDRNGLHGFYGRDGKMISGPKYRDITLTGSFVLAGLPSGLTRLADASGRKLGDFQLAGGFTAREYGGYILIKTEDTGTRMIKSDGAVVSKFAVHYGSMQSLVSDTGDRADPGQINYVADPEYEYEIFMFEEGLQILKIEKS